jgi:hypothetical protein
MADQLTWISGTQTNERYPDFKHKKIQEPLWIENRWNLPQVVTEMAAMAQAQCN